MHRLLQVFATIAFLSLGWTAHAGTTNVPVFAGSAYEIGQQHGQTFRTEIHQVVDALYDNYLGNPLYYYWAAWQAQQMEAYIPEYLQQEMQGVADGAEVDYMDILLGNTLPDLLMLAGKGAACSTYLVTAERSSDGGMQYGRNLDWYHDIAGLMRDIISPMVIAREGKERVLVVGVPGMVGVLSGINERGVAMSLMYSWSDDMSANGIPLTMLYREILEQATSTREALNLFANSGPRTIAINTMLADGETGVLIESDANKLAVREPSGGLLYAANHFESRAMIGDEEPGRDYRWPSLTQYDDTALALGIDDVTTVIADAAMEDRSFTNVLAFLVNYAEKTVIWGTGGPPAAAAPMTTLHLNDLFGVEGPSGAVGF